MIILGIVIKANFFEIYFNIFFGDNGRINKSFINKYEEQIFFGKFSK